MDAKDLLMDGREPSKCSYERPEEVDKSLQFCSQGEPILPDEAEEWEWSSQAQYKKFI